MLKPTLKLRYLKGRKTVLCNLFFWVEIDLKEKKNLRYFIVFETFVLDSLYLTI